MSEKLNRIGLNIKKSGELAGELNSLLANYHIFYQNLRGFHWNIRGKNFFELHLKFEELYTDALTKIDELAERILTLGHTPLHSFSEYLSLSDINEATNISGDRKSVEIVLKNFSVLIQKERKILGLAGDANDEGTTSLMSDYIKEQEKTVWMLASWLNDDK